MHYYSFNIGDYIKQTAHLSSMEDICYRRLLDMYYETEHPIPTETQRVSRRLRLDTELVDLVLNEFFTLTENGWANARCDAEIIAYHTKAETARSNGKLGGRPKKTKRVILANPELTQAKANQEPRTINHKPIINKNPAPEKPARFDPKDLPMPSGLKAEKWGEWVDYRLKAGKALKPASWVKQVEFIASCIAKGFDPAAMIDNSVRNGYTGLFEPKAWAGNGSRPYESEKDRSRREFTESIFGANKHEPTGERDITGSATRVD